MEDGKTDGWMDGKLEGFVLLKTEKKKKKKEGKWMEMDEKVEHLSELTYIKHSHVRRTRKPIYLPCQTGTTSSLSLLTLISRHQKTIFYKITY